MAARAGRRQSHQVPSQLDSLRDPMMASVHEMGMSPRCATTLDRASIHNARGAARTMMASSREVGMSSMRLYDSTAETLRPTVTCAVPSPLLSARIVS